jgi:hypothetical protein
MKNQSNQNENLNKILAFLQTNPNADKASISAGTGIAAIQVWSLGDKLMKTNLVTVKDKRYSLVDVPQAAKKPAVAKPKAPRKMTETPVVVEAAVGLLGVPEVPEAVDVPVVEETVAVKLGKNYGRDFSKTVFNGEELRKGKCVRNMVQAVVTRNPGITLAQLSKIFTFQVRTFGTFATLEQARKINQGGRQRYFSRNNDIIVLDNGTQLCVTNQITKENFVSILANANAAGVFLDNQK